MFLRIGVKMHAKTKKNKTEKLTQSINGRLQAKHGSVIFITTITQQCQQLQYHNRNILMSLVVIQFLDNTQHTQSLKVDTSLYSYQWH